MNDEFRKILNRIEDKEVSVPKDLTEKILLRINQKSKNKAIGLGFVSIASLLLAIPVVSQIITSFTQSGVYNYLSIIFSDSDVAITYWKELAMALVEGLPILGITVLLTIVLIFVWSTIKATSLARNVLETA